MIAHLGWQSLQHRRVVNDMSMFYNINFHHLNIDFPPDIKEKHFNYATRAIDRHCFQLDHSISAVDSHKFSSYIRYVPVWNSLPQAIFDNTLSVTQK